LACQAAVDAPGFLRLVGSFLASSLGRLLLDKGYRVVGAFRRGASLSLWQLNELCVTHADIEFVPFELFEYAISAAPSLTQDPTRFIISAGCRRVWGKDPSATEQGDQPPLQFINFQNSKLSPSPIQMKRAALKCPDGGPSVQSS
jgi:hypothetical protein